MKRAIMSPLMSRCFLISFFLFTTGPFLSGCKAQSSSEHLGENRAKPRDGSTKYLTLHGYNYTYRYIDGFSVDGNGGSNLSVSVPGDAGGGTVCCVPYIVGMKKLVVEVRWQSGACMYLEKSRHSSQIFNRTHNFYKEVKVEVDPNVPDRPEYFEVHFYPDGHVEAAITADVSGPRLISKPQEDRSAYPRCPNDKKPTT